VCLADGCFGPTENALARIGVTSKAEDYAAWVVMDRIGATESIPARSVAMPGAT
jgi:hypothetical protein